MTLKELLIKHEGLRLKPYRCTAGKLTIGVGRNLDDKGITEDEAMVMFGKSVTVKEAMAMLSKRGITEDEAMMMLDNDIRATTRALTETFSWFIFLDNVRKAVVVSMVFNLGLGGFLKFKNTIAAIRDKDWNEAADNMLQSKWAEQVGQRAYELAEMMRDGHAQ